MKHSPSGEYVNRPNWILTLSAANGMDVWRLSNQGTVQPLKSCNFEAFALELIYASRIPVRFSSAFKVTSKLWGSESVEGRADIEARV